MTSPRRSTNHRVATTAASGDDRQPVAAPMTTPQSSVSCQSALMPIVAAVPAAVREGAPTTTRRTPNRSISAAEKGAISPKSTRLIEIASETWSTRHPNSSSSGSIRIVGVARTPDAISSADERRPRDDPARSAPARISSRRGSRASGRSGATSPPFRSSTLLQSPSGSSPKTSSSAGDASIQASSSISRSSWPSPHPAYPP